MKESLQTLCDQFIRNRDTIKSTFRWESNYVYPVCANLFCSKGVSADAEKLRQCRELINSQTGLFSSFRGNIRIPLACMLSLEDNPQKKFGAAQGLYRALKEHFFGSDYLAMAAFLLTNYDCTPEKLARGKAIYRLMKEEHRFLTSSEDSIFAVLMAFSDKSDEALVHDMETCYRAMKGYFSDSNCVQTMSHIMAMSDENTKVVCDRAIALRDAIEKRGRKFGKHHELSILAALSTMKIEPESTAEEIVEADTFLAGQKGYGVFGFDKKTRLMHAAMIVSDEYVPHETMDQASLTGALSMIIAQQIMTCALVACTTSAAASTSN